MRPEYTHEATYRSPNEPPPEVPSLPVQAAYVVVLPALVWSVANPTVALAAVTLAVVALAAMAALRRHVGVPDWLPRPTRSAE